MHSQVAKNNIVFRVDSSVAIGYGHLMRCLSLAAALRQRGACCHFLCRDLPGNKNALVLSNGFLLIVLPGDEPLHLQPCDTAPKHQLWLGTTWQHDAAQCSVNLQRLQPDLIIVDHYALDFQWQSSVRPLCRKVAVIDDLADRSHACDILLDYNLSVQCRDYQALLPAHCLRLLGGKYVLLREEFLQWQFLSAQRRLNNKLEHILITFGGTDPDNNSEQVLRVLAGLGFTTLKRIDVVVSSKAPQLEHLLAYAAQMPVPTLVHTDVSNMAELIAGADLAIGSGGGSTYERLFLKLPSLLMPIADNQIKPLQKMHQAGLFELFFTFDELRQQLERYKTVALPVVAAPVLYGAPLVAELMLADDVTLADVTPFDVRRNYHWLQSDTLRRQFVLATRPERRQHIRYWRSLLHSSEQYVFSILLDSKHVGSIGVKNINQQCKEAEIWIYLGENGHRNRGVGTKALQLMEKFIKHSLLLNHIVLHVATENAAAIAFYHKQQYEFSDAELPAAFLGKGVVQMKKSL